MPASVPESRGLAMRTCYLVIGSVLCLLISAGCESSDHVNEQVLLHPQAGSTPNFTPHDDVYDRRAPNDNPHGYPFEADSPRAAQQ